MRSVAIAFVTLVLASGVALAQPGGILGVYTSPSGSGDCSLYEFVGSLQSVWVVHTAGPDIQGASFRLVNTWSATFISAVYPVTYINPPDLFGGDYFTLGGCYGPPSQFVRVDFLPLVYSPPCGGMISVEPDPDVASGEIEAVDCDGNALIAVAGPPLIVNPDETCPCAEPPIGNEQTTWGQIKALYR
jgi:hypothetical protein